MPMFAGSNIIITGGTFTEVVQNGPSGLEILKEVAAVGASHDSAERFPPPRCHPETRTSIINTILDWIADYERAAFILWLYGPAGAGKSAIAQTIAEYCEKLKQLAASYFFSRAVPGRNQAHNLFATIAYQVAQSVQGMDELVESIVKTDPTILQKSIAIQLQKLIVEPFSKLYQPQVGRQKWQMVIIIDGLDECQGEDVQCQIVNLIASIAESLPVCFIIASRPETWIVDTFDDDPANGSTKRCELHHSVDADNDIRSYLRAEFSRILDSRRHRRTMLRVPRPWPEKTVIDVLVLKATGQFVYAATIIRFLDDPYHRPSDRLDIVLGVSSIADPPESSPFQELDKLYLQILSTSHIQQPMVRVLAVIRVLLLHAHTKYLIQFKFLQRANSTDDILAVAEHLLQLRPGDAYLALRDLNSLIYLPDPKSPKSVSTGELRFFHASFYNFLDDPKRCRDYFVDLEDFQGEITRSCLKMMSNPPNSDLVEDYFGWIYAVFHWDYHWKRATHTQSLLDEFMAFDFRLNWLNVLTRESLPVGLELFEQVLESIAIERSDLYSIPVIVDAILGEEDYRKGSSSWLLVQPVYQAMFIATDDLFQERLGQSYDVKSLLLALCISGCTVLPARLVESAVNPRGGLDALGQPMSVFLYTDAYFGIKVSCFWDFLLDQSRAGKYFLDVGIWTSAATHFVHIAHTLPSYLEYQRTSYFRRLVELLRLAADSNGIVAGMDSVYEVLKSFLVSPDSSPAYSGIAGDITQYLESSSHTTRELVDKWRSLLK